MRLQAAGGFELVASSDGAWHVVWGERDWLGPVRARVASAGACASELVAGSRSDGRDDLGEFERLELSIRRHAASSRRLRAGVSRESAPGVPSRGA